MTRLSIVLAVMVMFSSTSPSQIAGYPLSRGPVSDYANKLSQAQVAELASIVQGYERETSIEVAIVVAESLQGQSARQYAMGIGDAWGVGKAGRNNGIILLWAPNERAYSLRIADGLSQDLSDDDAAQITRDNLLPNFRRGEYYLGLNETVNAVMRRLGNESWDERLRLRDERSQSSLPWPIAALVGGVSVSTIVGVVIYRRRQRNSKLQEMATVPESIAESLRVAQQNAPRIQQLLDDFKTEIPEQDVTRFASNLAEQPGRIATIKSDIAILDMTDVNLYAEVLQVKDRAEEETSLLSNTQWKLSEIRQAKAQSQQMLQRLVTENFQIANLRDESKREEVNNLLSNGRSLYNQAQQNSSMSLLDWIVINDLLNNSHRQVQQAVQVSETEPYTPPPVLDSSSYTASASSFGSGGDFGGGGGFSGGSGSDGSY